MLQQKSKAVHEAASSLQRLTAVQCKDMAQYEPLFTAFDTAMGAYNGYVASKMKPEFATWSWKFGTHHFYF